MHPYVLVFGTSLSGAVMLLPAALAWESRKLAAYTSETQSDDPWLVLWSIGMASAGGWCAAVSRSPRDLWVAAMVDRSAPPAFDPARWPVGRRAADPRSVRSDTRVRSLAFLLLVACERSISASRRTAPSGRRCYAARRALRLLCWSL